jgi:hypothetical protein
MKTLAIVDLSRAPFEQRTRWKRLMTRNPDGAVGWKRVIPGFALW